MTGEDTHMRRTAYGLTAAVLGSLAVAAPAMADSEIKDPCGTNDVSLPGIVNRDPTAPWLDLCSVDVRGTAGSNGLRGVHATSHVTGDTADRRGVAAYTFYFTAGDCNGTLRFEDLGPNSSGSRTSILGDCGGTSAPCAVPLEGCVTYTPGTEFQRVLPASAGKASGSTVSFDFDPGALPAHAVPKALLDAFAPGKSLTNLSAASFVRGQAGTTDDDGVFWLMDSADGDKPVALGGGTRKRARR